MHGRKIYEFALTTVPPRWKLFGQKWYCNRWCQKILIHQANEKMDETIIQRFYKLYDRPVPQTLPMYSWIRNSSVATGTYTIWFIN
jgi:3-oxoacyl-[acyl-carrier-protein] synthase-3